MMIFGCGYSGRAIATACAADFGPVHGTTRSPEKAEALKAEGIVAHIYRGDVIDADLFEALGDVTHLVQSIAPGADGDPLLRIGAAKLLGLMPKLQWIGYLSTVGVYGDHQGGWVDEESELRPVSRRSLERVEAEKGWRMLAAELSLPLAIMRLSGIYGLGRNAFVNLRAGTAKRIIKKDQVFNRIRVEDIAAATQFLAARKENGIFNVTDDNPCPPQDVVAYAASLMSVEPPPEIAFEDADMTPMARSFYGENKRVSNRKIRNLGFNFSHPEYQGSLRNLWECGI